LLTSLPASRAFAKIPRMTSAPEFVTVEELAARLRVNPATVRRWVASGRLAAFQVGDGAIRIRSADVEQFLSGPRPAGCTTDAGNRR
jgi:excisionase family DNA binding protein